MHGFTIKAKRGIEIWGSVRGGSLIATEGSVQVSEYVYGGANSLIIAGKDLILTMAQEINAEILGNIFIRKEATSCSLRTPGVVWMTDGTLVGGELFTSSGLEARVIGSEIGTKTVITLSSDVEASLAYSRTIIALELVQKELKLMKLRLGPIAEDLALALALTATEYERIRPLLERYEHLLQKQQALESQKYMMIVNARMRRRLTVNFHEAMFDGVVVRCQGREFKPEQRIDGPHSLDFDLRTKQFSLRKLHHLSEESLLSYSNPG
jgi:uncharacterized protein (DUF342 family)